MAILNLKTSDIQKVIIKPDQETIIYTASTYTFIGSGATSVSVENREVTIYTNPSGVVIIGSGATSVSFDGSEFTVFTPEVVVPTVTSDLTNDSGFITIDDVPEIPNFVGSGGTEVFFNDNEVIIYSTIPTDISAFNNDIGYITLSEVPAFPDFVGSGDTTVTLSGNTYIINTDAGIQSVDWDDVLNKPSLTLQSDFTGHTTNSDIHYPMSAITITESQINDLQSYALQTYVDNNFYTTGETYTRIEVDNLINPETTLQVADAYRIDSGTLNSGVLTDTHTINDICMEYAPMLDIYYMFNNLQDFNYLRVRYRCSRTVYVFAYNATLGWSVGYALPASATLTTATINADVSLFLPYVGYDTECEFYTSGQADYFDLDFVGFIGGKLPLEAIVENHIDDNTIHFKMSGITITESQISDLGSYATALDLTTHTGDGTIHFPMSGISITQSQISDFTEKTFVGSGDTVVTLSGSTYIINTDAGSASFSGLTDTTITSPQDNDSIIYSGGTWINKPSIDLETTVADGELLMRSGTTIVGYTIKTFVGSGDTTVTLSGNTYIVHSEAGMQSVDWTDVTNKPDLTLQSDFTGHTSNIDIHYAMSGISITESQISDLGSYATQSGLTAHTGDTSIHYAMSGISITQSQISDFTEKTIVGSGDTTVTLSGSTYIIHSVGTGGGIWGSITGTLSDQTDLQSALDAKTNQSDFTGHTGNTDIHYVMSGISITKSQVSDFPTLFSGHTLNYEFT